MSDTVVERKGFGTRMKNSFGGIISGIIFIIIGILVLVFNESSNVNNIRDTKELKDAYVDVVSDKIDKDSDGKLIATHGKLDYNDEVLKDSVFNVSISTPLLVRKVEVYQWDEETDEDDDKTTYNYRKIWSDEMIDSSKFKKESGHTNPEEKPYENQKYNASELKVGVYKLSNSFASSITANNNIEDFAEAIIPEGYTANGKYITNSEDVESPAIGDIRISFAYASYSDVSIMGKLSNDTVIDYTTKTGSKFTFFTEGTHDGKDMITSKEKSDKAMKWILRLVGTLAIIFGISGIFGPLTTLTSYVPILGRLVSGATGLISFFVGLAISLVIIAVSWIAFRPVLGIALLAIAIVLIIITKKCFTKKDPVPEQQTIEQKE